MSQNRYAVPIAELEGGARVALTEQVEEQSAPRLHEPLLATPVAPSGCGGAADGDGD